MGLMFEILTGVRANAAAFGAFTPNGTDTFTIRDFNEQLTAKLEDVWGQAATSQTLRIRSPRMHDSTNGLRLVTIAGQTRALMPHEAEEPLFPSDVLTVETSGTAAENDTVGLMVYYPDLPGVDARLADWASVKARIAHLVSLETDLAAPAAAGTYSAAVAIDALASALLANSDYAILGYLVDSQCTAVGYRGSDFGNFRVGGPGSDEADDTREWFVRQSLLHGTPHIPVFNSNNKGNVLVDVAKVALTATKVTSILALLK